VIFPLDQDRLEKACEVFKNFWPELEDPEEVQNMCEDFSERFRDLLLSFAVIWSCDEGKEWRLEWFDLGDHRPLPDVYPYKDAWEDGEREAHCVFRLGDTVYDWTARQYQDDAPVPLTWDAELLAW